METHFYVKHGMVQIVKIRINNFFGKIKSAFVLNTYLYIIFFFFFHILFFPILTFVFYYLLNGSGRYFPPLPWLRARGADIGSGRYSPPSLAESAGGILAAEDIPPLPWLKVRGGGYWQRKISPPSLAEGAGGRILAAEDIPPFPS